MVNVYIFFFIFSVFAETDIIKSIESEIIEIENNLLLVKNKMDLSSSKKQECDDAFDLIKLLKKKIINEPKMSEEDIKKMRLLIDKIRKISTPINSKPLTPVVIRKAAGLEIKKHKKIKKITEKEDSEDIHCLKSHSPSKKVDNSEDTY